MPLHRRLLLLFIGAAVLVLALGALGALLIRERDEATADNRAVELARVRVAQLSAAYSDQETGQRGYVLTGIDTFLVPFEAGRSTAADVLAALRETEARVPTLGDRLAEVDLAASRWRNASALSEIALRRAGDEQGAAAAVATGEGRELFEVLRGRLAALDAAVARAQRRTEQATETARWKITAFVALFLAVVLAGILVAAWLIRRWVTRPIAALAGDVRRVQGESLDLPIRTTGPSEIALLARDVDDMRLRLGSERRAVEHAREAVLQNAGVVLALRAHLEADVGELAGGWTVAAQIRPAEGLVAGDCYDLVRLGDDALGLVVIDISGHGAAEGVLALRAKDLIGAGLAAGRPPGAVLESMAAQLGVMGTETFLTSFVAVVHTDDGTIRFANAGHPPAMVVGADAAHDRDLEPTGPLVGLLAGGWRTESGHLPPGASLCIYTDGIVEIRDDAGEFFGVDRLRELLRSGGCGDAPGIVANTLDRAAAHSRGRVPDDATLVVLCRPQTPDPTGAT